MPVRSNIAGERFGRLVAIRPNGQAKSKKYLWLCKCDCGGERTVKIDNLTSGHTRSCGCMVSERRYTPDEANVLARARTQRWRETRKAHLASTRRRRGLSDHGVTETQYDEMFAKQNGACAVCKKPSPYNLHVDHDHSCCSGVYSCGRCVRGLLCLQCNRALGMLGDDPAILANAIEYLTVGAVETVRGPGESRKIQSELHGDMQKAAEMTASKLIQ